MKIFFLISSMTSGGAERVAATLCNGWVERGDKVTMVLTFSGQAECAYALSDRVHLIRLSHFANAVGRSPKAYVRRFLALRRIIAAARPDVIVSFLTNVNIAAIAVSRGLGIPVIVSERVNPVAENETTPLLRLSRRLAYPFADLVAVQAEAIVEPLRSCCPRVSAIAVVPNPLPPDIAAYTTNQSVPSRKRLVSMGRLTPQKQFDILIQAFSRVQNYHADWDLWIWGDGPLRDKLERLVSTLSLGSRVFLPGRTMDPWAALAGSQAFVLTSAFEGFPNVLLEAMAIGLPCVSYDCPSGPKEISMDGRVVILVPLHDARALGDALDRVMSDPKLRETLGQAARASVNERFSLDRVLTRWDFLFREAGVRNAKTQSADG
jgi:GalNAc-alpha-(1->4)-GalNAc-alpha-(1->3)-diNAcBac-PP-undecaprenol alpha-1,4-N-acetyl-D-galactosaminyltransferase